jgi:hypothetical protein
MITIRCPAITCRCLAIFALGSLLWGQVNTEAMRKGDLSPGLHTGLDLDFSLLAGNSDLIRLGAVIRFDYLAGTSHSFLVSNFQQGSLIEKHFVNKGFVHLRRTQFLRGHLSVEGFLQREYNEFIRLEERSLAGGGLRIRWLEARTDEKKQGIKLYTGLGFMWERERIRNAKDPTDALKDLLRSTNYVTLGWTPDDRLLLQFTSYIQPDIGHLNDLRVLLDGRLAFSLTGKLSVAIKLNSRYDNDPPIVLEKDGSEKHLRKYDMELTSGLAYIF